MMQRGVMTALARVELPLCAMNDAKSRWNTAMLTCPARACAYSWARACFFASRARSAGESEGVTGPLTQSPPPVFTTLAHAGPDQQKPPHEQVVRLRAIDPSLRAAPALAPHTRRVRATGPIETAQAFASSTPP